MATMIPNTFTTYAMSPEEELAGSILTVTQTQWIQNQLSIAAEEKLQLEFDPAEPQLYIQQEAYKRGQIELLSFLLETSLASIDARANPELPNT